MQSFSLPSSRFLSLKPLLPAALCSHSLSLSRRFLCSRSFSAMAVRSMAVIYVILLLVLMVEASKCSNGYPPRKLVEATPAKNQIRKLLHGKEEVFKGFGSLDDSLYGKDMVGWDLRQVPSGPDPLHHNGGGPKKPHTP